MKDIRTLVKISCTFVAKLVSSAVIGNLISRRCVIFFKASTFYFLAQAMLV